MNGADALFTGLADRFIRHDMREEVKQALQQSGFAGLEGGAHAAVSKVLRRFEEGSREAMPQAVVREHFDVIDRLPGIWALYWRTGHRRHPARRRDRPAMAG